MFVPDAHLSDALVVAVRTRDGSAMEDGVSLFLVPKGTAGVAVTLLPTIDETRKLCEVRLDNVAVPAASLLGEKHAGWPLWRGCSTGRLWRSAPRCAAAPSGCST